MLPLPKLGIIPLPDTLAGAGERRSPEAHRAGASIGGGSTRSRERRRPSEVIEALRRANLGRKASAQTWAKLSATHKGIASTLLLTHDVSLHLLGLSAP